MPVTPPDPPLEILVFQVEHARYGLAVRDVREILRAVAIARLPRAPGVVEGLIDVRGTLVPVLDTRRRFGLPEKALDPGDHLVLARAGDRTVALRVDRIISVLELDAGDVEGLGSALPHAENLSGVARLPEGLVLIYDVHTFLSQAESEMLDRALAKVDPCTTAAG